MIDASLLVPTSSKTIMIAFGHKARHGKDTAVAEIIKKRGDRYDIRRYAFADGIKEEVAGREAQIAFNYGVKLDPNPDMSDPLCPNGKHPEVLQFWGEHQRSKDKFYWIRKQAIKSCVEKPKIALISDMRFFTETAYVRACGGHLVKVNRVGFVDFSRSANHVSEIELDNFGDWDYEINVQEGDIAGLKSDAVSVFDMIMDTYKLPEVSQDEFKIAA